MLLRRLAPTALGLVLSGAIVPAAIAAEVLVAPYLQLVSTTAAFVLFETDGNATVLVEHGPTEALGQTATVTGDPDVGSVIYTAALTGLEPATRHWYRVTVDGVPGAVTSFVTPAEPGAGATTRLVAMSDMQVDSRNRGKFGEIVNSGVIPWVTGETGLPLDEAIQATVLPGDLVDDGLEHEEWITDFFGGGAALFASAPPYPAIGNHERNAPRYFRYFHLPDNGDEEGLKEHWWAHDIANVRLIGLNSNDVYAILPQQLEWFGAQLDDACADPDVDFVVAQLHHPHQSELWPVGESLFAQRVSDAMAAFSTECAKLSVMLFGHTHGYQRGASRDHPHFTVNVASGGGNIDYWGEYLQVDYEEAQIATDDYGFVLLEVSDGDAPAFRMTRVSLGNEDAPTGPVVRDEVEWRADNVPPPAPTATSGRGLGLAPECGTLRVEAPSDPDGDAIAAMQWQVSADCDDFGAPVIDRYVTAQNEFGGVDLNADVDLAAGRIADLEAGVEYCWRARARDAMLAWSEWSEPTWFRTNPSSLSPELLVNGDAEEDLDGWDTTNTEATRSGDCGAARAVSGDHMFAPGGSCSSRNNGSLSQTVDLSGYADAIDAGTLSFDLGAIAQTAFAYTSLVTTVRFVDAAGTPVGEPATESTQSFRWESVALTGAVPAGARAAIVGFSAEGSRAPLFAYVDNVRFRVGTLPDCEAAGDGSPRPGVDPDPDAGTADAGDTGVPDADGPDADTTDAGVPDTSASDAGADVTGEVRGGSGGGCAAAPAMPLAMFGWTALLALVRRRRSLAAPR